MKESLQGMANRLMTALKARGTDVNITIHLDGLGAIHCTIVQYGTRVSKNVINVEDDASSIKRWTDLATAISKTLGHDNYSTLILSIITSSITDHADRDEVHSPIVHVHREGLSISSIVLTSFTTALLTTLVYIGMIGKYIQL